MEEKFTLENLVAIWEQFYRDYNYVAAIQNAVDAYPAIKSIEVDYWDIDKFDTDLAEYLIDNPGRAIQAAERAMENFMPADSRYPIFFRVRHLPEDVAKIDIRNLRSEHLGKLVAVEGLVRKATEVRPRIQQAVFECRRCGLEFTHAQETFIFEEPLNCPREQGGCGRSAAGTKFRLLVEKSTYVNTQKIEIQELPEELRGGEEPQRLEIFLDEDLAGNIAPGDRVIFNGILRGRQRGFGQRKSTIFDIRLDGNNIEIQQEAYEEIKISPEEERDILELSRSSAIYDKIRNSIAPTIYGMTTEKEALMLQLFGGVPKLLPDGTRVRGDIHILLVGDPGTAKSQILRYIRNISPRGIYASGKASTAAGLTASASKDTSPFGEGRWTLEAGALVLADKGIACIDEIDKMSGQDRSSIHEAIEQQSISIAKAGITATLQSRCALLAAANPKQGRFDEYAPLVEQIELPTTLLTRFDVIFTITDRPDPVTDADMARHILRTHLGGEIRQYRKLKSGDVYSAEDEDDALSFIYPELSPEFLRKYIAYAKKNIIPVMSKDAMDAIEKYYVSLRNLPGASGVGGNGGQGPVTITARQLEAIIRLGEASARVRLSPEVTVEDAERAIRILEYYMQKVATEAGVRDYDYLATGIGHSQRTRIREIMKIIQEFCREDKTGVDLKTILDQAEARGLDRNKVMEDIEKLNIQGDIFKTQKGKYKLSSE